MEKKKTTEVEYDLSYYLGGNEEELLGRSSQQHTKMTRSGKPSGDVEPLQNTEVSRCTELSHETEQARPPENAPVQKRISAKMRKETLEAYKQAYLVPTKLVSRKAVYLSKETQERADLIVRRLGDRGSNLSSFIENLVRSHLEEYHEDIEKWRKL